VLRLPDWLKVRLPSDSGDLRKVARLLRESGLTTVCTGARCPNLADCWACGTATIMILGSECTRNCRFCAVSTNPRPVPPDKEEPARVAEAVARLGLTYSVITSVTRDDLPDQGAGQFCRTTRCIREKCPGAKVELLIPDLMGNEALLDIIVDSGPDVVGHNLETVRGLTRLVRDPRASYDRSLCVLRHLASRGQVSKTSLLLGLGESRDEVVDCLGEAYEAGVRHVALGQYLAPSAKHCPVTRYWTPGEFDEFGKTALEMGFLSAASGPLVRSSYMAEQFVGATL